MSTPRVKSPRGREQKLIWPCLFAFLLISGGIRSSWLPKVAKVISEKRQLRWVFVGIRGYPLVLVVKSLAIHRVFLLSSYFSGFSWISGDIRFARGQITDKCQGILPLRFQFFASLLVSGGIRYPWLPKVAKSNFRKAAGTLGFREYSEKSVGFDSQISCKSQGIFISRSQFLGFSWISGTISILFYGLKKKKKNNK